MRVRFAPESLLGIREKRAWWEQHRDKAPDLFVEELAAVVGSCVTAPTPSGGRIVWRILMPKCRAHVYYRINEAAEVEVLLLWNAVAGHAPDI